jgi:hypothetical protein
MDNIPIKPLSLSGDECNCLNCTPGLAPTLTEDDEIIHYCPDHGEYIKKCYGCQEVEWKIDET